MNVQGCDCSIVIKTAYREVDVPYSEETLREGVSLLQEQAPIEGDGIYRIIRKRGGVTGCVVTPLTIDTAPMLLYLAMGSAGNQVYVSQTRNLYQFRLDLLPIEDSDYFDLIQDRGGVRRIYEGCQVKSFELRIIRDEAVKLKLDLTSESPPVVYPYTDKVVTGTKTERFNGDYVSYKINGQEYKNIYGLTLTAKKEGGTKTELWIKRALEQGPDIPAIIDEMTITAKLLRDKYELRYYGTFRITFSRLILASDETEVNTAGAVVGPLRFYINENATAEVFANEE
jgi:hypothetical protein